MKKIVCTEPEQKKLIILSKDHIHPTVRVRALAVLMRINGIKNEEIVKTLDICENTIRNYLQLFKNGGTNELEKLNFYKPSGKLETHTKTLADYFEKNPPATVKRSIITIKKLTKVDIGETQARKFLKSLGLRPLKTGIIPAKADVEVQEKFLHEQLEPLLADAREGKSNVFFVDAAHFVFAAFLGYLWCKAKVYIKSYPGRQRFNVLGAIDAVTHEVISVCNTTYINAQSVCDLLKKISEQRFSGTITLIMDNARYQRCELVTNRAKELGIQLLFLPTYSPNLNLIERFWKLVKKECLQNNCYTTFEKFTEAIESYITNADITHSNELETLLTHKFQLFKENKAA